MKTALFSEFAVRRILPVTTAILVSVTVISLSSCSSRNPQEIYAEGVTAEAQNDIATALDRYQEIVRDFPTEAVAESSLYRVVMIRTNTEQDKRMVVEEQKRFLKMFPNSERVPTMIFMMAFLYNNEIRDIDSARKYYELFVKSYPDHELIPSARFELETLGEGPDELLGDRATNDRTAKNRKPGGDSR